MLDLPLDHPFQMFSQVDWGNQQFSVFGFRRIAREVVEQVSAVCSDLLVTGEHPEIGVQL